METDILRQALALAVSLSSDLRPCVCRFFFSLQKSTQANSFLFYLLRVQYVQGRIRGEWKINVWSEVWMHNRKIVALSIFLRVSCNARQCMCVESVEISV